MLVYEGILKSGLVDLKANKEEILELFDEEIIKQLENQENKEESEKKLSEKLEEKEKEN
jgi:hypothetical protein